MKSKQAVRLPQNYIYSFSHSLKVKVGIIYPGYGYERVSYALSVANFEFRRLFTLPLYKLMKSKVGFYRESPVVIDFGVDLLHTWNALPISMKPFVVSFECELPRYLNGSSEWQLKFGKKLLSSRRCRRILALSEAAKSCFLVEIGDIDDDLKSKVEVFRGGVTMPIPAKDQYAISGPIKIIFVGTDAVRKGILPLVSACETLIEKGLDIHLTFIGAFNEKNYVYKENIPDNNEIESRLKQAEWVTYKGRLPMGDVLNQMKIHDVLAFPTFDESLGWVPIEAGLLGIPTIATDIFALPELIEHQKTGYLIPINKRADRRFVGLNTVGDELRQHLDTANKDIETGLMKAIEHLYENRQLVEQWGRAAKSKLSAMYNSELAEKKLSKIYNEAITVN